MKNKCINGCVLPKAKKHIIKKEDNTYTYGLAVSNCCPICGALMPESIEKIKAFFEVYQLHPDLATAKRLIFKAELEAAARGAFIAVENKLRELSGLDLHGMDLATKALSFSYDQKAGTVTQMPLIAVNDLSSESKRNEQEGLRFLLMGFFTGQRNIYQHNNIRSGVSDSLSVVIEASFILKRLERHSILDGGQWIPDKTSYTEILEKMPRLIDRIKLKVDIKRNKPQLRHR